MSEEVFTQMASPVDGSMPTTKPELIKALNFANMKIQELLSDAENSELQLEEAVEEVKAKLLANRFGFYFLGMGVGGATAYFFAKRMLETKYSKIADEEISSMREHYHAKTRAVESEAAKKPVEDIVKERGYVSPEEKTSSPPMAVQPPARVLEGEDVRSDEFSDDSAMAADENTPDVEKFSPQTRNVFETAKSDFEWDWHEERKRRSPDIPYVIHYDERNDMDGFSDVSLTYYDGDDVVCNERDEILDAADRERQLGEKNLERFGHGSNDASIVYIRNDELEIVYEVVKSPNYYAEEVQGFSHHAYDSGNLERMRARERDEWQEN